MATPPRQWVQLLHIWALIMRNYFIGPRIPRRGDEFSSSLGNGNAGFQRVMRLYYWRLHTSNTNTVYNNDNLRYFPEYGRKEGNVLFNDALNTFYLRLYGVRHMVKDQSDSERGNPLSPHGLLFPISSNGSFICTIPHISYPIPRPFLLLSWSTSWNEK